MSLKRHVLGMKFSEDSLKRKLNNFREEGHWVKRTKFRFNNRRRVPILTASFGYILIDFDWRRKQKKNRVDIFFPSVTKRQVEHYFKKHASLHIWNLIG